MADKILDGIANDGNIPDRRYVYVKNSDVGAKYITESIGEVKEIRLYDSAGNFVKKTVFEYDSLTDTGEVKATRDYDATEV